MNIQSPLPGLHAAPGTEIARGFETLFSYPDVSGPVLARNARLIGQAGEDLVASILHRHGVCVLEARNLPSDKLLHCDGITAGLQVKTTTHPDAGGTYRFQVRQGCNRRGAGRRAYEAHHFDVMALVVLPENVIKFVASKTECQSIRACEILGLRAAPMASLVEALAAYGLHFGPLREDRA